MTSSGLLPVPPQHQRNEERVIGQSRSSGTAILAWKIAAKATRDPPEKKEEKKSTTYPFQFDNDEQRVVRHFRSGTPAAFA